MFGRNREGAGEEVAPRKGPPFPWRQIIILSLCRVVEPIAFCSIFPYIYNMVQSFHVTTETKQVAIYCGMITSIFAFSEFCTGFIWGRLSDKYGRKPVLMMGLFGTGLSMVIFGFSTTLPMALIARAVGGALNGNVGVLQTTVAEVVKVKEQQPFAFSIMPFVWCIGSIIGSTLGGVLVNERKADSNINSIWYKFPYLLPNVVAAGVVVCGLVVGFLFLEETHEEVKGRRDYGLELGKWLILKFNTLFGRKMNKTKDGVRNTEENAPLLQDNNNTHYNGGPSDDSASRKPRNSIERESFPDVDSDGMALNKAVGKTFNTQVRLHIVAYSIMAYHTISLDQLLPVILAMEQVNEHHDNIFKFTGGFGLSTHTIGVILGAQGAYQMVFQILFFAPIIYKLGALRTWQLCAFTYPILYFATPFLVVLPPGTIRMLGLTVMMVVKVTWAALAYPANMLLLTNAAPSLLVLGTINGAAASCGCLCRSFGPTLSGLLQSVGLDIGYSGIPLWFSAVIAVFGAIESLWMKDEEPVEESIPTDEDEMDERESVIFRRGSVYVNVSNNGEPSIGESQFLASLAHRGSVARRMSVATARRPSNAWSTLSRQTSRQTALRRERSISTVGTRAER